jgi:two-component system, OmpR family, response regulator
MTYRRGMAATVRAPAPPATVPAGRVLVVDDEPAVANFVARSLRRRGFAVDVALSGERGLDVALQGRHALIVLDLRMDDVDGLVILRQVMRARHEQRVLVLSAASDVGMRVRCLELGAGDFLAKPFELAELVARVGAQLRSAAPGREDRLLRAGRLTLDIARRTADAGRGPVALSEREFGVLRHLATRAGRPCSREELLAEVWDMRFDPGTNVVDVYVHRLRDKLGRGLIHTVRSLGYVLEV